MKEACELKTKGGTLRIERKSGSVWWEEQDYGMQYFYRVPEKQKEMNLRFSFRNRTYGLFCPLFFKRRKVLEAIAAVLVNNGVAVNAMGLEVAFQNHVVEEEESLQMLQVKRNDVLIVRETEGVKVVEVTLKNTKDVERFVDQVRSHALDAAGKLILRVGDATGCESYTPIPQLLGLLKGVELPRLQSLMVVYSIVGVKENVMECFACGSFPALLDVYVLHHDGVCVCCEGECVRSEEMRMNHEETHTKEEEKQTNEEETCMNHEETHTKEEETKPEQADQPIDGPSQIHTENIQQSTMQWKYMMWSCNVTCSCYMSEKNGQKYSSKEFVVSNKKMTTQAVNAKESRTVMFEGKTYEVPRLRSTYETCCVLKNQVKMVRIRKRE